MLAMIGEPDRLEQRLDSLAVLPRGAGAEEQRQLDVLVDVEDRDEIEGLEDISEVSVSQPFARSWSYMAG